MVVKSSQDAALPEGGSCLTLFSSRKRPTLVSSEYVQNVSPGSALCTCQACRLAPRTFRYRAVVLAGQDLFEVNVLLLLCEGVLDGRPSTSEHPVYRPRSLEGG